MIPIVSQNEWEKIEEALMRAEIPYKVNYDSHITENGDVIYDKIFSIDTFKIQTVCLKKEEVIKK